MVIRIDTLLLFFCICLGTAYGQSADKIITNHQKAIGGVKQLRRIDSAVYTGIVTNPSDGQTGRFSWKFKKPDRMLLEIDLNGFEVSSAFNGKSSWRRDSRDGLRTLTGQDGFQFKDESIYRNDHFLNYKLDKTQAVVTGPATVNGIAAIQLTVTNRQGLKRNVYFHQKTFMILRDEQETSAGTVTVSFGDYRQIDGIFEPFTIEIKNGDVILDVTINQIDHNKLIDDSVFNFPRVATEPLPDIPMLLRDVARNQENIRKTLEDFAYTEQVTEHRINNKGEIIDKDSQTIEISYFRGEKLERLLKKNGIALTKDQDEKEIKRLAKKIHDIDEQKTKEAEKKQKYGESKPQSDRKKTEDTESNHPGLSAFLHLCDFVNPRRERFRGRNVIVFDFQAKPGIKANGIHESLVQKLIGVMWVDEQAKQIVRLEARLNDKLRLAGGLFATLKPGGVILNEQDYFNNEVWLPSYTEINLSAKLFLLKGIDANQTIRYSDYRKFRVDPAKAVVKDPIQKKPE